jgi:pilus assembly protein Flp/PilA
MSQLIRFFGDDDGTTAVEYAVMLAMILMMVITAVTAVGSNSGGMWGNVNTQLQTTAFGS